MATIFDYIVRKTRPYAKVMGTAVGGPVEKTQREVCEMLEAYYDNNNLYDNIGVALKESGIWCAALKPLRNPTAAVVEFYAATVWPGPLQDALQIVGSDAVVEAIGDIWHRSNWEARKQLVIRQAAITGDVFLRVATTESRKPFIQCVLTKDVTNWHEDDAGNIVRLRYEVQRRPESGSADESKGLYYHTEVWTPETVRVYKHRRGFNQPEHALGEAEEKPNPYKFVPWVRACFRDVGQPFGYPAIWVALDKIDEINLKATRFSQLLFRHNQAMWAMKANAVDGDGRPMPAPAIKRDGVQVSQAATLGMKDGDIVSLPGNASLESLIPGIDWAAHAEAIVADINELKNDLPELRWYELSETSSASGVALAYMLGPAVARVREVRGNMERALIRVNMMAITVGQAAGLYKDAGSYDEGKTMHSFRDRDVIPSTQKERHEDAKLLVEAGVPVALALQVADHWSPERVQQLKDAMLDAAVASAGRTAGPAAPVEAQSVSRVIARDAAQPTLEASVSTAITGALDRGLGEFNAQLAEFLGARK